MNDKAEVVIFAGDAEPRRETISVAPDAHGLVAPTNAHIRADSTALYLAVEAAEKLFASQDAPVTIQFISSTMPDDPAPINEQSDVQVARMPEFRPTSIDIGDAHIIRPDGSWYVRDIEVSVVALEAAQPDLLGLGPIGIINEVARAQTHQEQLLNNAITGLLRDGVPVGAAIEFRFDPDAGQTLGFRPTQQDETFIAR